jgi:hypothetical protein
LRVCCSRALKAGQPAAGLRRIYLTLVETRPEAEMGKGKGKEKNDAAKSKAAGTAKARPTTKAAGPVLPPLLVEVARWIEGQPDHALGYFELSAVTFTLHLLAVGGRRRFDEGIRRSLECRMA